MDDSDDEFEDAVEIQPGTEMNLDTAILECKAAVDLFFNNKFIEARAILAPWWSCLQRYQGIQQVAVRKTTTCVSHFGSKQSSPKCLNLFLTYMLNNMERVGKSMYHTIGNSVFLFLEAVLTFEQEAITKASDALKSCINLCNRQRRKSSLTFESLGKIIRKKNYTNYSAVEVHAELCYAEAILLKSALSILEDESLVSFIRAGMKIRTCYNSYKECSIILKSRHWTNDTHKIHFESGVHVGIGAFNLMISFLPNRVIKLLEFIGFSGSKAVGLAELDKGYQLHEGIRQVLSIMTLLTYNLIIMYVLSHGEGDLDFSEKILLRQLQLYPEGAWYLYFKGRLEFMKGNISDANHYYIKSWQSQSIWPQFHHLCFWELMWTNCVMLNWKETILYATHLLQHSRWSKCIYAYSKVAAMLMRNNLTLDEINEVDTLTQNIPQWRQRFVGKSIPMEKFCSRRCERYSSQKFLVLPAIELMYVWNYFKVLGKKWDLCQEVYKTILNSLAEYERGKYVSSEFVNDNKALLLLLKGACLYQMQSYFQAEECLKQVIFMGKKIKEDTFIVPFALVELAIVYHDQGLTQKALETLEDVKKNYSGYSLESRLHFKIHSATLDYSDSPKAHR